MIVTVIMLIVIGYLCGCISSNLFSNCSRTEFSHAPQATIASAIKIISTIATLFHSF